MTSDREERMRQRLWRWTGDFRERTSDVRQAYLAAWRPFPRHTSRLCIVTTGRAGSELLSDLLDRHPLVTSEGEILRHGAQFTRAFLRGRAHLAYRAGARAYVFKIAALQLGFPRMILQPKLLFADLAADGFTFVHLRRRDVLRQAISHVRGKQTGIFHVRTDLPGVGSGHVIDPAQVVASLVATEENETLIEDALDGLAVRSLWYEDHLEDPDDRKATVASLFRDLGVEPVFVESDLRRQAPKDLRDAVANLDAIVATLRTTRFAPLVEHLDSTVATGA